MKLAIQVVLIGNQGLAYIEGTREIIDERHILGIVSEIRRACLVELIVSLLNPGSARLDI